MYMYPFSQFNSKLFYVSSILSPNVWAIYLIVKFIVEIGDFAHETCICFWYFPFDWRISEWLLTCQYKVM